jgi:hypothetical protein
MNWHQAIGKEMARRERYDLVMDEWFATPIKFDIPKEPTPVDIGRIQAHLNYLTNKINEHIDASIKKKKSNTI